MIFSYFFKFDGYLARKLNQKTMIGSILDPIADKTLMVALTGALTIQGSLPIYLSTLIIGRDIILVINSFILRYKMLPEPKTWNRYWDTSIKSAEINPTQISKINTFLQFNLLGLTLGSLSYFPQIIPYLPICHGIVSITTIWSGLSYYYEKNVIKELKPDLDLMKKRIKRRKKFINSKDQD